MQRSERARAIGETTNHATGTREEWLAARVALLAEEKELTRRGDELTRRRQDLPWVRLDKHYSFETDDGKASLVDLFRGRSQLLVYHFMFGPDYAAGCLSCSTIADGFNGFAIHLANHDVMLWAVSRAPLARLHAYRRRMGWSFPWASSNDDDFNFDFDASVTEEQQRSGGSDYNFRAQPPQTTGGGAHGRTARGVGGHHGNRLADVHAGTARDERIRARRRCRLPHPLGIRARA